MGGRLAVLFEKSGAVFLAISASPARMRERGPGLEDVRAEATRNSSHDGGKDAYRIIGIRSAARPPRTRRTAFPGRRFRVHPRRPRKAVLLGVGRATSPGIEPSKKGGPCSTPLSADCRNTWFVQEIREAGSGHQPARRLLQLLLTARQVADHARDGGWRHPLLLAVR